MPNIEPHVPTPESQAETTALQSEVPALPAPETQPAPLMMAANAEGEAIPALTAMTMDPATGAPATNAANAAIEQNIATLSTESVEATTQATTQANAQATAQADQAPTTTPAAADGANSAASQVTTETNANDGKASNPEKVS
jgi:hypothetical protein